MKRYLSIHDLVWLNSIVTGDSLDYDYDAVESCIAAQYRYGGGGDLKVIAVLLLQTAVDLHPFTHGNRRTAYLAFLTFLQVNGYEIKVSDMEAAAIYQSYLRGDIGSEEVVKGIFKSAQTRNMESASLRDTIVYLCNAYGEALKPLTIDDAPKQKTG